MTDTDVVSRVPSDAELISATRAGDDEAYAELYRRHGGAAEAAARSLTRSKNDADDLVAEAFTRLLQTIRNGGGPQVAFRPYLLTAVRNVFYDRTRKDKRLDVTADVPEEVDLSALRSAASDEDRAMIAAAFASLPERWQMVLWHTEVEGRSPAEVAPLIGLAPNATAALAYRAREGLRQAFLQAHLQRPIPLACQEARPKLGAYVRDGLSLRDRRKVDEHLEGCKDCRALLAELEDTNDSLRVVLIPLLLGVPAAEYLGAVAGTKGIVGWFKHAPRAAQMAVGTVAAASVVGLAAVAVAATGGGGGGSAAPPSTTIAVGAVGAVGQGAGGAAGDSARGPVETNPTVVVVETPSTSTTEPSTTTTTEPSTTTTTTTITFDDGNTATQNIPLLPRRRTTTTVAEDTPVVTTEAPAVTTTSPPTTQAPTVTTKPAATTTTPPPTTLPPTTTTVPTIGDLFVFTPSGPVFAGQNAAFSVTFNSPVLSLGLRADVRSDVARFIPVLGHALAPRAQAAGAVATFNIPDDIKLVEASWDCAQAGNVTCTLPPTDPGGQATSAFVLAVPAKVGATIEFNTFLDLNGKQFKGPRIVLKVDQQPPTETRAPQETVVAETIVGGTRGNPPEQTKPTQPVETPPPTAAEATLETANTARDTSPPTGTTTATTESPPPPPLVEEAPPTETSSDAALG
jgi:RNA polymerase sigma factor (sigma-70 family)